MAEFAYGPTGHNYHDGHCRNPWNTAHVTGGSSSGSGSSVAARAGFAALGSDTGGSVRLPAAICGITGLKVTYGRVSRAGAMPLSHSMDTVGPLARSAQDCALLLGVLAGADPADLTAAAEPVPDYRARLQVPVKGLRVGIPMSYFTDDMDPGVGAALTESLKALESLGCEIVPVSDVMGDFSNGPASGVGRKLQPAGRRSGDLGFECGGSGLEPGEDRRGPGDPGAGGAPGRRGAPGGPRSGAGARSGQSGDRPCGRP